VEKKEAKGLKTMQHVGNSKKTGAGQHTKTKMIALDVQWGGNDAAVGKEGGRRMVEWSRVGCD